METIELELMLMPHGALRRVTAIITAHRVIYVTDFGIPYDVLR